MKNSIKISIPEPCHEDWAQMTPQEKGRHCAVCDKTVVDFSQTTDEGLFKQLQNGESLCGRFKPTQLNREITLSRKRKNPLLDYAASLLIPIAVLGSSNIAAQKSPTETTKTYKSLGIGSLQREKAPLDDSNYNRQDYVQKQLSMTPSKSLESVVEGDDIKTYKIIKGNVTAEGEPLPGVNVVVQGTSRATQTDFDGNFTIGLTKGDILEVSFPGYVTRTFTIGSVRDMKIVLDPNEMMGEVNIIAGMIRIDPVKNINKKKKN